jgi:hypothetical protein
MCQRNGVNLDLGYRVRLVFRWGVSSADRVGSMSSDLIALVVGITLGIAVVVLGLRRNLADVTRSWLPQFGEPPERGAMPELFEGGQGHRQFSPRQTRFAIWASLLFSACYAALAVLSTDDRLMHVIGAALFAIVAVVHMLRLRRLIAR